VPAKSDGVAACSRRRFLGTAAAAFAAAAFPDLIPARALGREGGVPAASNRIALGLVGTSQGWVNAERLLPFPDVVLTAICDTDSTRMARAVTRANEHYKGATARPWKDFREMFASARLDAVVLAAPDHWHGVMGVAAVRAGLDVFGEKPLAHTLAEGRAVCEAVRTHGRVWQTGSWQRSVPIFHRAAELIRGGALGTISHVECGTLGGAPAPAPTPENLGKPPAHLDYEMWVGPAQWTDYDPRVTHLRWRYVSNYGGGRLIDFVGHHVDIALWALGLDHTGPVRMRGNGDFATTPPYDIETRYEYECEFANGLRLLASSEFQQGAKFYGDRGWLLIGRGRGINGAAFLRASDPRLLEEAVPDSLPRRDNHWRDFVDCVKSRSTPIAHAEAGHRSASIGHLAHIAIQTGREIRWDPVSENILDDPSASALLRPVFRGQWGI
jgi:predicted dehydrogenase